MPVAGGVRDTAALPAVDGPARPVFDGAAFGLYEDEAPSSRLPIIVGSVLAVAVVAVGLLTWRAVNTDAELVVPVTPTTEAPSPTLPDAEPTVEAALALVDDRVTSCAPDAEQPTDLPPRVQLTCPIDGVPSAVRYVLFGSLGDRDDAFDDLVASFEVPADGAECALGQVGAHDFIGVERVGRVACHRGPDGVDFTWTTDEAPILAVASGGGPFVDHYRFWADLVERTDAAFPLAAERALLDLLPAEARVGCARDLGLNVDAPGVAAVVCRPADAAAGVMSSVQFDGGVAMATWIEGRRSGLSGNVFDQTEDGCTPDGFGRLDVVATTAPAVPADDEAAGEPPPPPPDAAFADYELDGTTGKVLCFVNSTGSNAVFWTRDDLLVGSIAVSDRGAGKTMAELLTWWESGGHRP